MDRDRLLFGLAAVFAGLTVVLVVVSFVRQPFLLLIALPFAAFTYLLWQHATGRLEEQARTRTRRRRRTTRSTGRRADGSPGGSGATAGRSAGGRGATGGGRAGTQFSSTLTRSEAYRTLGLDPGANEAAVRRAYRAKVKEVHPDTDGGDEEAFKRVTRAYEVLTD